MHLLGAVQIATSVVDDSEVAESPCGICIPCVRPTESEPPLAQLLGDVQVADAEVKIVRQEEDAEVRRRFGDLGERLASLFHVSVECGLSGAFCELQFEFLTSGFFGFSPLFLGLSQLVRRLGLPRCVLGTLAFARGFLFWEGRLARTIPAAPSNP